MSTFGPTPIATFHGDTGDASLDGLTLDLSGVCENNSLSSAHHVVSRYVRSDLVRRTLFGINGESRRITHAQQVAKFVV